MNIMINTKNLQLLPVEPSHIEAFLRSKSDLAALLHVSIPNSWPTFPEAFSSPSNPAQESESQPTDWRGYFFIHPEKGALVGNGGFYGEPDRSGIVEIGYEIAREYWNCGFATEAVQGMIRYAFAHKDVNAIVAHTLAEKNASNTVLQKVGMKFIAEVDDSETGKLWRWQINRSELQEN